MPSFIKTKKDEKKWDRAKNVVEDQYSKSGGKSESDFSNSDWGLTDHIFQNMGSGKTRFKRLKDKIKRG